MHTHQTPSTETDYTTREATDQRLDEVLTDLCLLGITWKLSSREQVRVKNIIADNMAVIAQGLHGKGKLGFPSTIYKLCKDARVPMREFKRTSRIPQEKPITAKRMETMRLPRNVPQQHQDEDDEDEPMAQAGGGNEEDQD
ncbi:hypothetical protein PIB30_076305 [Stylosanthes scabra]|uniref:Uncharacterized protein n=1 Tax=Stylosanthes scabra TaxID=79078 RepID=A0ABU6ZNU6_9FABA|nr:hypothetical protein [Stylosanthes scabra]